MDQRGKDGVASVGLDAIGGEQIDRAHCDWSEAQIGFLANVVRIDRGEAVDVTRGDVMWA